LKLSYRLCRSILYTCRPPLFFFGNLLPHPCAARRQASGRGSRVSSLVARADLISSSSRFTSITLSYVHPTFCVPSGCVWHITSVTFILNRKSNPVELFQWIRDIYSYPHAWRGDVLSLCPLPPKVHPPPGATIRPPQSLTNLVDRSPLARNVSKK